MKLILRNTLTLFLLTYLMLAGSCIMDDGPECNVGAEHEVTYRMGFMAVRLQSADGYESRATVGDSYEYGESSEVALAPSAYHYAIFYKKSQARPLAVASLTEISSSYNGEPYQNSSVVMATIAAKSERKELLEEFEDCIILLNTEFRNDELWNYSQEDLEKITVYSPFYHDSNGKNYFRMVNATYVENGVKKVATTVDTSKIFNSYMECLEQVLKGNAAVNAYVERVAAKVGVRFENDSFNETGVQRIFTPENNKLIVFDHLNEAGIPFYVTGPAYDPHGNLYRFKVKLTGWGLNGTEQESFLFRRLNPTANYFTGWYNTANRRVYWSEDVNYDRATYPWQYRKVIDNSGIPVYENGGNILRNLSYTDLNDASFSKSVYSLENTYDFADAAFKRSLDNRPEYLAGSHIIVCAELLTNLRDVNNYEAVDLYRDRYSNFYKGEKECFKAMVTIMNNILKSHAFLKFTYWDWDKGGVENKLFARTKGEYSLWWNNIKLTPQNIDNLPDNLPFLSPAEFKGSDGKRIIWMDGMTIRDDAGNELQTYSNISEVDSSKDIYLRPSSINDMKSVIFEHIGAVDHFKDGKMYYAIPIGLVSSNPATTGALSTGYSVYGLVRNCVYDIMIHGVKGIGASVDVVDQPIIPNTVGTSENLFLSFKILDWHVTSETVKGEIK